MIKTTLIIFLNALMGFFEGAFQSKDHDEDFFKDIPAGKHVPSQVSLDSLLQEAYAFMECCPPVTMNEVKKQYKCLSLKYHPDRNNQSQESIDLQQKLNASFARIEEALEGGGDQEGEVKTQPETKENEPDLDEILRKAEEVYNRHQKNKESKKKHDAKKTRKRHQRQEAFRRQCQIRKTLQIEKRTIRKEAKKVDWEHRQAANLIFFDQVKVQLDCNPELNQTPLKKEKSTYSTIECCDDDLAVAIRMGKIKIVLDILNDEYNERFLRKIKELQEQAFQEGRDIHCKQQSLGISLAVLTKKLDSDSNTPLHYAVYWEQAIIIRELVEMAQVDSQLDGVMSAKNIYGHTPIDYASIAIDPSILPLMQSQEYLVKLHREQTQLWPAMTKAFHQSLTILKNVHLGTTLTSMLGFFIGRYGFQLHWLFSILGVAILQTKNDGIDRHNLSSITTMTSFYLLCSIGVYSTKWFYSIFLWKTAFLLPTFLLFCFLCGKEAFDILFSPFFLFEAIKSLMYGYMQKNYECVLNMWSKNRLHILGSSTIRGILLLEILICSLGLQFLNV
jgi:hypothetical protein